MKKANVRIACLEHNFLLSLFLRSEKESMVLVAVSERVSEVSWAGFL